MSNAVAQLGAIDILVNNAGVAGFWQSTHDGFRDVQEEMAVNYLGVLRVTRAVAPGMITQRDGMIVNVATAFAKVNLPLVGTYCATKAALLSLGQALRAYLSSTALCDHRHADNDRHRHESRRERAEDDERVCCGEILNAIREERHDPPIGDEAKGDFRNVDQKMRLGSRR